MSASDFIFAALAIAFWLFIAWRSYFQAGPLMAAVVVIVGLLVPLVGVLLEAY